MGRQIKRKREEGKTSEKTKKRKERRRKDKREVFCVWSIKPYVISQEVSCRQSKVNFDPLNVCCPRVSLLYSIGF